MKVIYCFSASRTPAFPLWKGMCSVDSTTNKQTRVPYVNCGGQQRVFRLETMTLLVMDREFDSGHTVSWYILLGLREGKELNRRVRAHLRIAFLHPTLKMF